MFYDATGWLETMESIKKYDDVTGVILAGGKSARMGRDKALLKVEGVTLFDRVLYVMEELFTNVLIAGDRPDLGRTDLPYYPDLYPGSALGGLYTGLRRSKNDMIFVTSCDMPFPDANIARLIVSENKGYDVVVPRTPNGFEPLFALYNKSCLPFMKDMLEKDEFRIYDFYPLAHVRYLSVQEFPSNWQWLLMNVNTPEELERIKEKKQ
jgi:molybdopterin-guanine dinucleotide biosynthesis protein A